MNLKRNVIALTLVWGSLALPPGQLKAQEQEAIQGTTTLDEVVVTAGSIEESKRELTVNATVLNEAALKRSTAKNLADLLRQNGFQVYSPGDGSASQRLYIRGFGGSSMSNNEMTYPVLVLLNGHRTGNADVGLMGLENVERVEILRGPGAVQYGSSAMGGVVNIITKRGSETPAINAEAGIGSYDRFDQKFGFSGAANGFEIAAGFKHSSRNAYKTGDGGSTWRRTDYDGKSNADIDLGYSFLGNHRLGAHLNYAKIDDGKSPSSGITDTLAYKNQFNQNNNTAYNFTFSYEGSTENRLLSWKTAYTHGKLDEKLKGYVDGSPGNPYVGAFWGQAPYYPGLNNFYNTLTEMDQFQAQLTYDNGILSLTGGYDYVNYDTTVSYADYSWASGKTNESSETDNYAAYLLAKLRLLDDSLILSAGGRYDSYEISHRNHDASSRNKADNDNFSPSLGLAWLPNDFIKLRVHYAKGFVMPTTSQLFGGYMTDPNHDLKAAKSDTYEFGVDLAYENLDASLTYFHSEYKNKITPVQLSNGNYINRNLDGATISGFELSFGYDLGGLMNQEFILRPYTCLTYLTQRKNKDKNTYVSLDPDTLSDTPKITASYGLAFDHPGLSLAGALNAAYLGKRYIRDFSATRSLTNGPIWHETGGFTVWDLSMDKRLWEFEDKGALGLRLEVNNLFDKDYAPTYDYPMPGRNFYVGLNYNY